jgi:hypothetical protein
MSALALVTKTHCDHVTVTPPSTSFDPSQLSGAFRRDPKPRAIAREVSTAVTRDTPRRWRSKRDPHPFEMLQEPVMSRKTTTFTTTTGQFDDYDFAVRIAAAKLANSSMLSVSPRRRPSIPALPNARSADLAPNACCSALRSVFLLA